jgi:hypothetical protein
MTAVAGAVCPLPDLNLVRELLGMLFDGLVVKTGAKLDVSSKSTGWVAVYVDDEGKPVALCACNIAFAANTGAALSMLPPGVAKDSIKTGQLTEVMLANLREVMNICTRLVLHEGTVHVRLDTVCPAAKLPAAAAAIAAAPKARIDFEVTLGKYGNGMLAALVI